MQNYKKENLEISDEIGLSVIIPLSPNEDDLSILINDLSSLPKNSEVIFVTANVIEHHTLKIANSEILVRTIRAQNGRACCMNTGAKEANGVYLFFIHADSHFEKGAISKLLKAINKYPNALLYFNLAFYKGASYLMKLNEWGANFRSHFLRTPFGDQGFCVRRDIFEQLGGFPTDAPYGEDHLFVRNVVRKKIPLISINATLFTSPRKYENNGWLKTTLSHLYLWRRQAYEDFIKHRRVGVK